jgi:hypothetical protein
MAKVEIKSSYHPYEWQRVVHLGLKEHWKGYFHIVKSKRQCGKSIMLEMILLKTAVENKGTTSICLSPTLEQARKVYKELVNGIVNTPVYKKSNDQRLAIILSNGSEILFKSAEQKEALRGFTVSGIYCIDEAAYIPDEIFNLTIAWTNVHRPPILICSSPHYKTGFFYKYYTMGEDSENLNVFSYDWSKYDTSALLDAETLENYRKTLAKDIFKTDFLGEFLDNESGVFGEFDEVLSDKYQPDLNCFMGIDWGTGANQDETAIALFNEDREMIGLHHWNDKDETQTLNEIIKLIREYHPLKVQVELNSIGSVFYGLLDKQIKKENLPVMLIGFNTTNSSKQRLVNNLQVAIQNKSIKLLNDKHLVTELTMYEGKLSPSGKMTYNAASGYHDDLVIATMLALDCITKANYCIR